MLSLENSPGIVSAKADLKEIFIAILDTVKEAFISFYEWLKAVPVPAPPTVLKLFSNNKANLILFTVLVVYVFFINIRGYLMFAADKRYAERKVERIPERTLLKYIWLGGALGSGISMIIHHHKTQRMSFVISAAVLVAVQLVLFSFILGFLGFWTFF